VKNVDLINLVEAAYRVTLPSAEWLRLLAEETAKILTPASGLIAYFYDSSDKTRTPKTGQAQLVGLDPSFAETVQEMFAELPLGIAHALLPPTVLCTMAASLVPTADGQGGAFWRRVRSQGFTDAWGLVAGGADGRGVLLSGLLRAAETPSSRDRDSWTRIGVHIAAGHRLRQQLAGTAVLDAADAVFGHDGSLDHTDDERLKSSDARAELQAGVRNMERSRGRMRRLDSPGAVELWRGLVAGRWSLIEHIDRDGKRFVVAKENEPGVVDPRSLTSRERQVVHFVAHGHDNALIGYELGLDASTVAAHLKNSLKKLGFSSRSELVAFYGQLARAAPGAGLPKEPDVE
jgi:DNA-binding CsgD family transcriptional regulator